MPLVEKPLHRLFVAAISGVDLRQPLDRDGVAEIVDAMDRHGVCVFHHEPPLRDEEHVAFSRHFGHLEGSGIVTVAGHVRTRRQVPEIIDVSNLDPDGNILAFDSRRRLFLKGNAQWHTDGSFVQNRARYSALAAHEVPPKDADTEFADMRAAYDALPETMKKKLEGLVAEHSVWYSRVTAGYPQPTEEELKSRPPAQHPIVQTHAGSKRKTLYIASHCSHILGMPIDEGRALLKELMTHATQPQFVYRHKWSVGDLVMWDNCATMHRGTEYNDTEHRRDIRRTTGYEGAVA